MILRRLAQNLREQNWTAIVIEFVLLVSGVFLGIQVANWNSDAIDRREAYDAMHRLRNDMQLSIDLTEKSIAFMSENVRLSNLVFDRLDACNLPERDRDDFASGLYLLGKMSSARFVRTTFDELRDSGKFGLIRSAGLRQELNETARRQEAHEVIFRLIATRTDPHIAYIDGNVIYRIDDTIGGDARLAWTQLDIDFDDICADRRFKAAVAAVRNYSYDNLYDVRNQQARFKAVLAMIEKEQARP